VQSRSLLRVNEGRIVLLFYGRRVEKRGSRCRAGSAKEGPKQRPVWRTRGEGLGQRQATSDKRQAVVVQDEEGEDARRRTEKAQKRMRERETATGGEEEEEKA